MQFKASSLNGTRSENHYEKESFVLGSTDRADGKLQCSQFVPDIKEGQDVLKSQS